MHSRMKQFRVKILKDGRAMLNLACGGHMHPEWNNVDFSLLVRLVKHPRLARLLRRCGVLSEKRYNRVLATDRDLICWDLRKGIPFASNTFDVVYHSHFLEHIERDAASGFLKECGRVLKPSGMLRIVVPDLHQLCEEYVLSHDRLQQQREPSSESLAQHQDAVSRLVRQMIVAEPRGTMEQRRPVRVIERFIRGDSMKAGEAHRWMYDNLTLGHLLKDAGFVGVRHESYSSSAINGWSTFALDTNDEGGAYKSRSLYMEASKPC